MSDTSHGVGGLSFDKSKRALPAEAGVAIALVMIVVAFELLGRVLSFRTDSHAPLLFHKGGYALAGPHPEQPARG